MEQNMDTLTKQQNKFKKEKYLENAPDPMQMAPVTEDPLRMGGQMPDYISSTQKQSPLVEVVDLLDEVNQSGWTNKWDEQQKHKWDLVSSFTMTSDKSGLISQKFFKEYGNMTLPELL